MFIGHYAPALAIKKAAPAVPMWGLFGAVQMVDIGWSILVPMGIERAHVAPEEALPGMPIVLDYMPYTHSLLGCFLISLVFGLFVSLFVKGARRGVIVWITLAGVSHWLLDLLVHQPDLTLYGAPPKLGFSLWAYKWPEFALEMAMLAIGFFIYLRATMANGAIGRIAPWAVLALMVVAGVVEKTMPVPTSVEQGTTMALAIYLLFIACGFWLDRTRGVKTS